MARVSRYARSPFSENPSNRKLSFREDPFSDSQGDKDKKKGRGPSYELGSRPKANSRAEDVLLGGKVQFAPDLYGGLDGPGHRTAILVHFDHTLYGLPILLLSAEMEGMLDPL